MRFDRCYVTNSLCGPSRACILTGKYSHKNGFYDNTSQTVRWQPGDFPEAAAIGRLSDGDRRQVASGERADGLRLLGDRAGAGAVLSARFYFGRRPAESVPGYVTEVITDLAIDWLKNKRDAKRPFLMMVQHKAPHRPWEPAPEKLSDREQEKIDGAADAI